MDRRGLADGHVWRQQRRHPGGGRGALERPRAHGGAGEWVGGWVRPWARALGGFGGGQLERPRGGKRACRGWVGLGRTQSAIWSGAVGVPHHYCWGSGAAPCPSTCRDWKPPTCVSPSSVASIHPSPPAPHTRTRAPTGQCGAGPGGSQARHHPPPRRAHRPPLQPHLAAAAAAAAGGGRGGGHGSECHGRGRRRLHGQVRAGGVCISAN